MKELYMIIEIENNNNKCWTHKECGIEQKNLQAQLKCYNNAYKDSKFVGIKYIDFD